MAKHELIYDYLFLYSLKFKSTIQQLSFNHGFKKLYVKNAKLVFFFSEKKKSFKLEILVHFAQNYYHVIGVFVLSEKWTEKKNFQQSKFPCFNSP